ncbi:hypothetical protein C4K04_2029 [Pseudomonas chlororaphis]|jgi:hypothetical protein|uniref:Uncharacterized protein n=1 Tax=Pseudomonas chlororaphis TaxID=587753 RepID=A0A3G7TKU9_9PSED|nr:hypothetical protein [Pseudomonas chlororaphis]AZE47713.1 hypothetical protein C4K04_2029 [Pseudomonas chlororaphis]
MTSIELKNFQNKIQNLFKPFGWAPTERQLEELARRFAELNPASFDNAFKVFKEIFPGLYYEAFEGMDNSDYKALLAVAIAGSKAAQR